MTYDVDGYMDRLYQRRKGQFDIDSVSGPQEHREFCREMGSAFASCLGEMPRPQPLEVSVISQTQRDGYKRIKIEYTLEEGFRAPAYILVPDGATDKTPAVVALHGHSYGVADAIGLTKEGEEKPKDGNPGYQKHFPVELAKRGFVVAVPELLGFGELMLVPNDRHDKTYNSCFMISTQLLLHGRTMAGMRVFQGLRMLDYLSSRQDVDASRIGAMGISGGGLATSFLTAYESRIKACVVSGYLCTFKDSIMDVYHCVDNFLPGVLNLGEMADLFGVIAPRPMLIEAGIHDDIFPIDGVKSSYARIEGLYDRLGAKGRLDIDIFEGEHQISGAKAYDFMVQWL